MLHRQKNTLNFYYYILNFINKEHVEMSIFPSYINIYIKFSTYTMAYKVQKIKLDLANSLILTITIFVIL